METATVWVGIDAGERTSTLCFLEEGGGSQHRVIEGCRTVEVVEALSLVPRANISAIAIEASSGHRLARELAGLGYPVFALDPGRAQKFLSIRSVKSDHNDALGLAEIARHGTSASLAVHIKNLTSEQIRVQLTLRDQLVRQKVALRNSLRSHLRTMDSDVTALPPPTRLREFVEAEILKMEAKGMSAVVPEITSLLEVAEALSRCVDRLDKRFATLAHQIPATRRLMGIPGVGSISALSFYCAIEDPHRFTRNADVAAYLGLTPSFKQSGSSARRGRITKAGNKLTRGHLVMAATTILTRAAGKSALSDWGKDLRARVGWGKAKVAVARKLAVVMLTIWKGSLSFDPYPPPSLAPTGRADADPDHMSMA